jgi:hypothetical protein
MKVLSAAFSYIDRTEMLSVDKFNEVIQALCKEYEYSNLVQDDNREDNSIIESKLVEEDDDDWDSLDNVEIKEDQYIYNSTFFKIVSDTLIISHAPILTAKGQTVAEVINGVMKKFQDANYKKVYHLCPEVIPSSIEWTGLGRDHICLRLLEYDGNALRNDVLIDPRSIVQQFYDGVNCGRYVIMMFASALRSIENGAFTQEIFNKNPLIINATIFKTVADLQLAAKFLYQYPVLDDLAYESNIREQLRFIYQFRCDQGLEYHALSHYIPSSVFCGFSARDKLNALNHDDNSSESKVLKQGSCGYFLDLLHKEENDIKIKAFNNKLN